MMSRLSPLLIPALLLAAPVALSPAAYAGEVEEAEHLRLEEEMQKLASRSAWGGVESAYQELLVLATQGEPLTFDDHQLGAQAAKALGNMAAAENRLRAALRIQDSPELLSEIENIEQIYAPVALSWEKGAEATELSIATMPFAPEQRNAVETAQNQLAEQKKFEGLLPLGDYTYGNQKFSIDPGGDRDSVQKIHLTADAVVSSDSSDGFAFTYVGPRAHLGASYTVAGAPEGTQQPPSFSGIGARLGAGLEVGLGIRAGAMVEVGYHNLLSNNDAGYGDTLHLGYGMIGPSYRIRDIWLSGGGIFAAGVSKASGINNEDSVNSDCPYGSLDEDCAWVAAVPEDDRSAYPWNGNIRPAGVQVSGSYAILDIGTSLKGAVTLTGGALFDPDRTYPWGQLAFTVAPVPTRSQ